VRTRSRSLGRTWPLTNESQASGRGAGQGERHRRPRRFYRSLGQPNLLITPDREKCARYGLNVGDVGAVVQAAIGGQAVTQVLEGDRRFDLVVRWQKPYRADLDAIRNIRVTVPDGSQVRLLRSPTSRRRKARHSSIAITSNAMCRCALRFADAICRAPSTRQGYRRARGQVARRRASRMAGEYGELREADRRLISSCRSRYC